jgi:hypothetical protein
MRQLLYDSKILKKAMLSRAESIAFVYLNHWFRPAKALPLFGTDAFTAAI